MQPKIYGQHLHLHFYVKIMKFTKLVRTKLALVISLYISEFINIILKYCHMDFNS